MVVYLELEGGEDMVSELELFVYLDGVGIVLEWERKFWNWFLTQREAVKR